ncbi:MAG: hypothetical protein JNM93_12325 [Bacteriovoracaceae bacterium]|nr:hypothetical protein [Bacteriovoracaceae bacterium]
MHSKWQVWDFTKTRPTIVDEKFQITAFQVFDPLIPVLFNRRLPLYLRENKKKLYLGAEVNRNVIEAEFESLSLFGQQDCICILNAEDISKNYWENLKSALAKTTARVLFYFEHSSGLFDMLSKEYFADCVTIEAPKFWEIGKLLDLISDELNVQLSFEAKNYFLEIIQHKPLSIFNALNVLKINLPEKSEIQKSDLEANLVLERMDIFSLANDFSKKHFSTFYEQLLNSEMDYDELRSFFAFMQSHLVKLADPSYLEKKNRASKYDKEILTLSKNWKRPELIHLMNEFSRLEIMCKQKNVQLKHELRREFMRSFEK